MYPSAIRIMVCLTVFLFTVFAPLRLATAQESRCRDRLRPEEETDLGPPVMTLVAPDQRLKVFKGELIERVRNGDLPSVSVGVMKHGRILWEQSIGWADEGKGIAATPCTPYGLASLGKSITATAVMVLVERDKVELNAPIARYLGEVTLRVFEGDPDQVTVRRVLNMTAAIPHGLATFHDEGKMRTYAKDQVKNRGIVVFPPGEVYLYSNFAYAVLEEMIKSVSRKSYSEFLRSEVFAPLGMTASFISRHTEPGAMAPAALYGEDGALLSPVFALPQNSLAMHSSVDDLLRYASFHLGVGQFKGQRVIGNALLDRMHRLRGEAPHSLIALGFGSVDLDEQRLWLLTNGRAGGSQAALSMIPSEGLAVVCLVNATGRIADELVFRITDSLVPGFMDRAQEIIGAYEDWAEQPYQPSAELLGQWQGEISTTDAQVPVTLLFQEDGDIHVQVEQQPETILSDVAYRQGLLTGRFIGELSTEQGAGHPHLVTVSLRLKGNRLSGYVTSDFTNDDGRFSLASYVRLSRPEPSDARREAQENDDNG